MKTQDSPTIAIIGSGRVASALGSHFKEHGIKITGVHSRNIKTGSKLAEETGSSFFEKISDLKADVVLVSVNDDQTVNVIDKIHPDQSVIYTAGSVELKSIKNKIRGVFYPLQTFGIHNEFENINFPILLEADSLELQKQMIAICDLCNLKHTFCDSEKRKEYHLVAVMLNNFVNHIVHLSQEEAEKRALDWTLLSPLLKKTFSLLIDQKAKKMQTGPARRNDQGILKKHEEMLEKQKKEIYQVLSASILNTYKDEL